MHPSHGKFGNPPAVALLSFELKKMHICFFQQRIWGPVIHEENEEIFFRDFQENNERKLQHHDLKWMIIQHAAIVSPYCGFDHKTMANAPKPWGAKTPAAVPQDSPRSSQSAIHLIQ